MGGFVSSPSGVPGIPTGPGFNPLGLLFGLFGAAGGTNYSGTQADWMAQQLGRMGPSLQEWFRSVPAPAGTPLELMQPSTSGVFYGFPKWIEQRFVEAGGQLPTGDPTQNAWWMNFLSNPLNIITTPFYGTFSRPWQQEQPQEPPEEDPGGLKSPTDPNRGTGNPTEPGDVTIPPPPGVEPDIWSGIWNWFKTSFPDLWRTATQAQVLDKWYETTQNPGGLKPPTDPNRQTGPTGEPTDWTIGAGASQNPADWGVVYVPPQAQDPLAQLTQGITTGGGGGYNFTPVGGGTPFVIGNPTIRTDVNEFNPPNIPAQFPLMPTTTPSLQPWPATSGGYNFTPPYTGPTQVIYDPSPIGNPTLPAVPPVTPPNTTEKKPSDKAPETEKKPDLGNLALGLGMAAQVKGGAGPPGPTAPIVGGGQTQSAFQLPGLTSVPPTLADFFKALFRRQ